MGIRLNLPIKIKADDIGAIYLAKNFSLSQNTKNIDIHRHFVREHQEEGTIDTTFIRSEDNEADILTKNTSEEIFLCHQSKLMQDVRKIK
jgi:ferredoxin-NADP reductase